jgi:hypothetical protein
LLIRNLPTFQTNPVRAMRGRIAGVEGWVYDDEGSGDARWGSVENGLQEMTCRTAQMSYAMP